MLLRSKIEQQKFLILLASSYFLLQSTACSKQEVLDCIYNKKWIRIYEHDFDKQKSRDEIKWENELSFARSHLEKSGYMLPIHDYWGITGKGIGYFLSLYQEAQDTLYSDFGKITIEAMRDAKDIAEKLYDINDIYADDLNYRDNVLKPYPFCGDGNRKVYVRAVQMGGDAEMQMPNLHLSILNKSMLDVDTMIAEDLLRPYNMHDNNGEPIAAMLHPLLYYRPYFYEYVVENCPMEIQKFFHENSQEWLLAEFLKDTSPNINGRNQVFLDGSIIFGAGPIVSIKRTLVVSDERVPEHIRLLADKVFGKIDAIFSNFEMEEKKRLKRITGILDKLTLCDDCQIEIMNVGQGNCVHICTSNNKSILFDIGFSSNPGSADWEDFLVLDNKKQIEAIKPDLVILSHWDLDHIIGVCFANEYIYTANWIAPNINWLKHDASLGAIRLALFLHWKNKLFLTGDSYLGENVYTNANSTFEIWQGQGNSHILNRANNFGLILILNHTNTAALCGDCEYAMFPTAISISQRRYEFLLVPHHCSKMSLPDVTAIKSALDDDYAIISVGDNKYGHPDEYHEAHLNSNMQYKVTRTEGIPKFTIVSLAGKKCIY